jgi:hypothetical protein
MMQNLNSYQSKNKTKKMIISRFKENSRTYRTFLIDWKSLDMSKIQSNEQAYRILYTENGNMNKAIATRLKAMQTLSDFDT